MTLGQGPFNNSLSFTLEMRALKECHKKNTETHNNIHLYLIEIQPVEIGVLYFA